jgi:hypothetical protein
VLLVVGTTEIVGAPAQGVLVYLLSILTPTGTDGTSRRLAPYANYNLILLNLLVYILFG